MHYIWWNNVKWWNLLEFISIDLWILHVINTLLPKTTISITMCLLCPLSLRLYIPHGFCMVLLPVAYFPINMLQKETQSIYNNLFFVYFIDSGLFYLCVSIITNIRNFQQRKYYNHYIVDEPTCIGIIVTGWIPWVDLEKLCWDICPHFNLQEWQWKYRETDQITACWGLAGIRWLSIR